MKNMSFPDQFIPNIERFLVELRFVGKVEGIKLPQFFCRFTAFGTIKK